MSPQFAVEAAELAGNANLLDENGIILPYLKEGIMGVACGLLLAQQMMSEMQQNFS